MTAALLQVVVFLAAAAIAAPIGRFLGIGAVLGYLAAGVVIGPFVLGRYYALEDADQVLHLGEFGVVLLLFVIGLELRPIRLWSMRSAIFGLGVAQLVITAFLLAAIGLALGLPPSQALFIGLALSLSSTAFALQVMEERGELTTRHGRLAFSVLLFQDLAAIPLIALVPLFALGVEEPKMDLASAGLAILTIAGVILVGRFLLSRLYHLVAATGVREAMTASALLTVVGVALIMEAVGLSAALGSFIAGALLADSEYRHQIEADIAPFEGLLLAVFFIAVGMSIDLSVLVAQLGRCWPSSQVCFWVKATVLYGLGRWWGLANASARRLGIILSQGGEFAFVLFSVGMFEGVIGRDTASLLTLAVTLSMAATPLLLLIDDVVARALTPAPPDYEMPPEGEQHVIIAGFGRFGQIVARVLRARHIPFTALDASIAQVTSSSRFGAEIYYGDAGRIDILRAAGARKAQAFVLAIDNVDASIRVAEVVRENFPDLPIYARARDRIHVHRLLDLGVTIIERETFLSALELTRQLLRGLGLKPDEVTRLIATFKRHDEKRLYDDYKIYTDQEKMRANALSAAVELEDLFTKDVQDLGDGDSPASGERRDDRGSAG
ncbi:monovalent cation:proton antiporter-2 (CPA2) family protein [Methyloceanibacter marginalis]|uniref:monovalent cation:proton antiporter-2 (CPA2) family protein n=1 Tax=Methyloceanibacter marginalis TaxID=1774971 RepID=UPI00084C28E0|nr:monovalent cation:proton antiporter-2 (CPA2) family protein [Methyloceanibacter marginalis]